MLYNGFEIVPIFTSSLCIVLQKFFKDKIRLPGYYQFLETNILTVFHIFIVVLLLNPSLVTTSTRDPEIDLVSGYSPYVTPVHRAGYWVFLFGYSGFLPSSLSPIVQNHIKVEALYY